MWFFFRIQCFKALKEIKLKLYIKTSIDQFKKNMAIKIKFFRNVWNLKWPTVQKKSTNANPYTLNEIYLFLAGYI